MTAIYVNLLRSTQTLAIGTSVCNAANLAPVPILPGKSLEITLGGLGLLLFGGLGYRASRRRMDDRHDAISLRKQLEIFARTLPTASDDDEEPAPSTIDQTKKKQQDDLATLARVDELKKRFHELAVLHRGDKKKPIGRPTRDSDIPIVFESDRPPPPKPPSSSPPPSRSRPPSSADFSDELTERRGPLVLPQDLAEIVPDSDVESSEAPPTKPKSRRV